jgi:hypothetical protein
MYLLSETLHGCQNKTEILAELLQSGELLIPHFCRNDIVVYQR